MAIPDKVKMEGTPEASGLYINLSKCFRMIIDRHMDEGVKGFVQGYNIIFKCNFPVTVFRQLLL
jgi:hypothetical protein